MKRTSGLYISIHPLTGQKVKEPSVAKNIDINKNKVSNNIIYYSGIANLSAPGKHLIVNSLPDNISPSTQI